MGLYGQLRYDRRELPRAQMLTRIQMRSNTSLQGLSRRARAHITVEVKATSEAPVLLFITLLLFLSVTQALAAQSGSQRRPGAPTPLSCCQVHPKVSHLSLFCPVLLFSQLGGRSWRGEVSLHPLPPPSLFAISCNWLVPGLMSNQLIFRGAYESFADGKARRESSKM